MIPLFSTLLFIIPIYLFSNRFKMNPKNSLFVTIAIIILLYLTFSQESKKKKNLHHITKGKEVAKNTNIILATCVRNASDSIYNIECFYNKFNAIFKKVKLVVLENDSTDKTREDLLNLKQEKINDMDIVGCGLDQDQCYLKLNNIRTGISYERTRRMAKIRNILLSHIKSIQKDYDYCAMFDGDLEIDEFENDGIFDTMYYLDKDKKIDAIAANTYQDHGEVYNKIYDFYAFKPVRGTRLSSLVYYFKDGIVKVKSAFNGLVIYRLPFTDEIKYDENTKTCEHIGFHEQLDNMYINTNFVIEITGH
jgi:hypothetical protein